MWYLIKSKNKVSSRRQIRLKEIRDGILILPGNEYRLIVETSSVNFELKSSAEQDVLIDNFQSFLNSLPCKIQILIRVREIDIARYIEQITRSQEEEKEKIYRAQIKDYCQFIANLVKGNKILSRKFYIIVPCQSDEKNKDFNLIKEQLNLNRDIIIKGIEKLGMQARSLGSLEILDLFYNFYSPTQSKLQELTAKALESISERQYV